MLKILQARLQQYTENFQMFKLVLEKAEEPEIKLPISAGSLKKQENSRKVSISVLLTTPNLRLCGSPFHHIMPINFRIFSLAILRCSGGVTEPVV